MRNFPIWRGNKKIFPAFLPPWLCLVRIVLSHERHDNKTLHTPWNMNDYWVSMLETQSCHHW